MFGSTGKILRVNLTDRKTKEEKIPEEDLRKFFGGRCLGSKILLDELDPGIDPLGPKNKLIFATGPITGVPFPGNSRYAVMAKSPLTGMWGEAHAAGFFAPELKFAGYDHVIVEGKADNPVFLWIHDETTEIKDASNLWGKVVGDVQSSIRDQLRDKKIRVAAIGPGGENLVRFSCVISDLHRAAGRCGLGAVMGSKKLKAIAVRGTDKIEVADESRLRLLAKNAAKEAWDGWGEGLHDDGTDGLLDDLHGSGRLPTMAFRKCTFDGNDRITGETMTDTILVNRWHCFACNVGCIRQVEAKEPYDVNPDYGGPEYETAAALGSLCMVDDLVAISKANELANKYTLDTISLGVVIAFAMECYEKGIITKEEANGIDLTWGNPEAIIQLTQKIAKRAGIGDILAEGVMRAAQKIGKGSKKYALHIKGQELPMHEPRGKKGLGLSYAVSNRGACHLQMPHDDSFESEDDLNPAIGLTSEIAPRYRTSAGKSKVQLVKIGQDLWSLYDSLVVCKFTFYPAGISTETLVELVHSITGWDVTPMELMTVGERAVNITRAFNVREGANRKDDCLPDRLNEPLPEGMLKGEALTKELLDEMLDYYYEIREWDIATGIPTKSKLEKLGISHIADKLP